MEKMPRFTGGFIAYLRYPVFSQPGEAIWYQTGADRRRQTARAQSAISVPGDRAKWSCS